MSERATPAVGTIRFHDSVKPPLPAGKYRITSSLEVGTDDGAALEGPPVRSAHLEVQTPTRFSLDRSEVATCQPGPEAAGAFGDMLPAVILARRTLPWERPGPGGGPWLALLVFGDGEARIEPGTVRGSLPPPVVSALGVGVDEPISVLRVEDPAVFRQVMGTPRDVSLLAHVRQVNLADTALAGADDDGWFAAVSASRLPLVQGGAPTRYLASLVSLECRDDAFAVPAGAPAPPLVSLFHWRFSSRSAEGTFKWLITSMDTAPFGAPAPGEAPIVDLADGSLPLERVDRHGARTVARYCGPLRGVGADAPPTPVSLEAASQLGKLIGLSDPELLREAASWHRSVEAEVRTAAVAREVTGAVAGRDARAPASVSTRDVARALLAHLRPVATRASDPWRSHPAGQAAVRAALRASGGSTAPVSATDAEEEEVL